MSPTRAPEPGDNNTSAPDPGDDLRLSEFVRFAVDKGLVDYRIREDGEWEFTIETGDPDTSETFLEPRECPDARWWHQWVPMTLISSLVGLLLGMIFLGQIFHQRV